MRSRRRTGHSRSARAWPESSVWALALLLAAYLLPQGDEAAWALKEAVLTGLALFASVRLLGRFPAAKDSTGLVTPLLLFASWTAVSVAWSLDPVKGMGGALAMLGGFLFMVSAAGIPATGLCWTVFSLAAMEAVAGMVQLNLGPGGRLHGTFIHAGHHAALLVCGYALASSRFIKSESGGSWFWGLASYLLLAAAALSGTRTVAAAALCIAGFLLLNGGSRIRRAALMALTVVALATPGGIAARVADQIAGREPLPMGRLELWRASLRIVAAKPLLGAGAGSFADAYPAVRPASLAHLEAEHAHNELLQVAAETGLPGLCLAFWAVFALWSRLRRAEDGRWGRGRSAVLAGLAVFGLLDNVLHVPVLAWIAVCMLATEGKTAPGGKPGKRVGAWIRTGMMALAAVAAGWMFLGVFSEMAYARGVALFEKGSGSEARAEFERALRFSRFNAAAAQAIAETAPSDPKSRELLARAARLRPAWVPLMQTAFEADLVRGDVGAARKTLDRAFAADPHGLSTALMRVRFLGASGEAAAAERELAEIERRAPRNIDVLFERARLLEMGGKTEECRRILLGIVAAFPGNRFAQSWLERLGP